MKKKILINYKNLLGRRQRTTNYDNFVHFIYIYIIIILRKFKNISLFDFFFGF